jgi:putative membrane protein
MHMHEADHARVTAAVAEAEAGTSGEIVTIVAARSDGYEDIGLIWAAGVMLLALACITAWPSLLTCPIDWLRGGWSHEGSQRELIGWLFALLSLKFLAVWLLMRIQLLRNLLTPGRIKAARVRDRAVTLFRASAERRTTGHTGILIYLSMQEHRAEIIADQAIHSAVAPEAWGDAMAALIDGVRDGRPGDGLVEAVRQVGTILNQHLPRAADDQNELPDRLIEL